MTYKQELYNLIEDGELSITNNIEEAIYYFDGQYIGGEFCDGIRGVDHNVLIFNDWQEVLDNGIVIVPETKTYISKKRDNVLDELNFKFEKVL